LEPAHFGVAAGSSGKVRRRRHLPGLQRFPSSAAPFRMAYGPFERRGPEPAEAPQPAGTVPLPGRLPLAMTAGRA